MNGKTFHDQEPKDLLLLKWHYRSNLFPDSVNSYQNHNCNFSSEMDKLIGKFIWKFKESQTAKATGKEKGEGLTLPNFTNYKATVIETVCTGIKIHIYIDRIDLESKNKPIHF